MSEDRRVPLASLVFQEDSQEDTTSSKDNDNDAPSPVIEARRTPTARRPSLPSLTSFKSISAKSPGLGSRELLLGVNSTRSKEVFAATLEARRTSISSVVDDRRLSATSLNSMVEADVKIKRSGSLFSVSSKSSLSESKSPNMITPDSPVISPLIRDMIARSKSNDVATSLETRHSSNSSIEDGLRSKSGTFSRRYSLASLLDEEAKKKQFRSGSMLSASSKASHAESKSPSTAPKETPLGTPLKSREIFTTTKSNRSSFRIWEQYSINEASVDSSDGIASPKGNTLENAIASSVSAPARHRRVRSHSLVDLSGAVVVPTESSADFSTFDRFKAILKKVSHSSKASSAAQFESFNVDSFNSNATTFERRIFSNSSQTSSSLTNLFSIERNTSVTSLKNVVSKSPLNSTEISGKTASNKVSDGLDLWIPSVLLDPNDNPLSCDMSRLLVPTSNVNISSLAPSTPAQVESIFDGELSEKQLNSILCKLTSSEIKDNLLRLYKSLNQFRTLLSVSQSISTSSLEKKDVFTQIIDCASKVVQCERVSLFLLSENGEFLTATCSHDESILDIEIPIGCGIPGFVAQFRTPLIIQDAYSDSRFSNLFDKRTGSLTHNVICVPVFDSSNGNILAVLEAINKLYPESDNFELGSNCFLPEDLTVLEFLGLISGHAMSQAMLYDDAVTSRYHMEVLLDIQKQLSIESETEMVIGKIFDAAYTLVKAEQILLFLVDSARSELVCKVSKDSIGLRIPLSQGFIGQVARTGQSFRCNNVPENSLYDKVLDEKFGFVFRSTIAIPICDQTGNCVAVIQAINKINGVFTELDEVLLDSMGSAAGLTLRKAQLFESAVAGQRKTQAMLRLVKSDFQFSSLSLEASKGSSSIPENESQSILVSLWDHIIGIAHDLVDAEVILLYMVDSNSNELWTINQDRKHKNRPAHSKRNSFTAPESKVSAFQDLLLSSSPLQKYTMDDSLSVRTHPELNSEAVSASNDIVNPTFSTYSWDVGLSGFVARSGVGVNVDDAFSDERHDPNIYDVPNKFVTKSLMCIPIKDLEGCTIAVLETRNKKTGSQCFTDEDVDLMSAFCLETGNILRKYISEVMLQRATAGQDHNVQSLMESFMNLGPKQTTYVQTTHVPSFERIRSSFSLTVASNATTVSSNHSSTTITPDEKASPNIAPKIRRSQTTNSVLASSMSILDNRRSNTISSLITVTPAINTFEFDNNQSFYMDFEESLKLSSFWVLQGNAYFSNPSYISGLKLLDTLEFNVFDYGHETLVRFAFKMLQDIGIFETTRVSSQDLFNFIVTVSCRYRDNPFHNWRHGFSVFQFIYWSVKHGGFEQSLTKLDLIGLFIAGICHDLDHPGHNNQFEINTQSNLALQYNDEAVLENYHSFMTFLVLKQNGCNIFSKLETDEWKYVRKVIVSSIFATDMTKHFSICKKIDSAYGNSAAGSTMNNSLRKAPPPSALLSIDENDAAKKCIFDINVPDDRLLLCETIVHSADLSGQVYKYEIIIAEWERCISSEFFHQARKEQDMGMVPAPFMDNLHNAMHRAKMQINFIDFVLTPLFKAASRALPHMRVCFDNLMSSRKLYQNHLTRFENEKSILISKNFNEKDIPAFPPLIDSSIKNSHVLPVLAEFSYSALEKAHYSPNVFTLINHVKSPNNSSFQSFSSVISSNGKHSPRPLDISEQSINIDVSRLKISPQNSGRLDSYFTLNSHDAKALSVSEDLIIKGSIIDQISSPNRRKSGAGVGSSFSVHKGGTIIEKISTPRMSPFLDHVAHADSNHSEFKDESLTNLFPVVSLLKDVTIKSPINSDLPLLSPTHVKGGLFSPTRSRLAKPDLKPGLSNLKFVIHSPKSE